MIFYKIIFTIFSTIIINSFVFIKPFYLINFSYSKLFKCKHCIDNIQLFENIYIPTIDNFDKSLSGKNLTEFIKKKNLKKYEYKILKTSILNFLPFLKLHHIVIISDKSSIYNKIYTIDFSPINQTYPTTLLKLFFSKKVRGEIRIRLIENISFNDNIKIINKWNNLNKLSYNESQKISDKIFNEINNIELKYIFKKIKLYDNYMNLYNNNCQHFSKYIIKKL
jgi:hypothetical protein